MPEGSSQPFTIRLAGRPAANVIVTVARLGGDSNLAVVAGASLTFSPSNWFVPRAVTLRATPDLDRVEGTAVFRASAPGWQSADVWATEQEPASAGAETVARPNDS